MGTAAGAGATLGLKVTLLALLAGIKLIQLPDNAKHPPPKIADTVAGVAVLVKLV